MPIVRPFRESRSHVSLEVVDSDGEASIIELIRTESEQIAIRGNGRIETGEERRAEIRSLKEGLHSNHFNSDQKYPSQSSSGQVVAVMQAAKFGRKEDPAA
jgi:hypothetical protein